MSSFQIKTEHREGNKIGRMTMRVAALDGAIREGFSEEVTFKL